MSDERRADKRCAIITAWGAAGWRGTDVNGVASAAALALAALFAWAGASKLVRPEQTATAFRGLGVPAPVVLARLTPPLELAIAAGLVLAPRPAAIVAIAMLATFSLVLGRAVRVGAAVPCACFGSARAEPVSRVDLLRNVVLAGMGLAAMGTTRVVVPPIEALVLVSTAGLTSAVALALLGIGDRSPDA